MHILKDSYVESLKASETVYEISEVLQVHISSINKMKQGDDLLSADIHCVRILQKI